MTATVKVHCQHLSQKSSLLLLASMYLSIQIIKKQIQNDTKVSLNHHVSLVSDMSVSSLRKFQLCCHPEDTTDGGSFLFLLSAVRLIMFGSMKLFGQELPLLSSCLSTVKRSERKGDVKYTFQCLSLFGTVLLTLKIFMEESVGLLTMLPCNELLSASFIFYSLLWAYIFLVAVQFAS